MANLYPPSIEGTLPAYNLEGDTLSVPFEHNKTVTESQFKYIVAKVKNIQSGKMVFDVLKTQTYENGKALFKKGENPQLSQLNKIGMSYKIQLGYSTDGSTCQYYSTAGIFKVTGDPGISIDELERFKYNSIKSQYIGTYSNEDSTEKVNEYKFTIFDDEDNVVETTGWCLSYQNDSDTATTSHNTFNPSVGLEKDKLYTIRYYVKTYNGLELYTPKYKISITNTIDPGIKGTLQAEIDEDGYEDGYIKLFLVDDAFEPEVSNGKFILERCQDGKWTTIHKFSLLGQLPSSWSYKDFTIEQGIEYTYAIREYSNTITSNRLMLVDKLGNEITITPDFDYMYLYDGERQLKIKYNPKVSSFKTDILEQKQDTIGSKYAFFTRNGATNYKEFPISGLISYIGDENGLFYELTAEPESERLKYNFTRCNEELPYVTKRIYYYENGNLAGIGKDGHLEEAEYYADPRTYFYYKPSTTLGELVQCASWEEYSITKGYRSADGKLINGNGYVSRENYEKDPTKYYYYTYSHNETYTNNTDYTTNTVFYERLFKLQVLDWLNNGKPKLFRSPTEGNYIVRLMNVSLTPNDTLGRKIHTFNATAYEVAEANSSELASGGFIDIDEPSLENLHYKTIYLGDLDTSTLSEKEAINNALSSYKNIKRVELTEFMPGDLFLIDGAEFRIGSTGNLYYDGDISNVSASDIPPYMYGYITLAYYDDTVDTEIVHYESITTDRIPCLQWIGRNTDIMDYRNPDVTEDTYSKIIYNENTIEDAKYSLIEIKQALFEKRKVVDIYYFGDNFDGTYPSSFDDYYWDYNKTDAVDKLNDWEIYQIHVEDTPAISSLEDGEPTTGFIRGKNYYIDRDTNKFYKVEGSYLDSAINKVWKSTEYNCNLSFVGQYTQATSYSYEYKLSTEYKEGCIYYTKEEDEYKLAGNNGYITKNEYNKNPDSYYYKRNTILYYYLDKNIYKVIPSNVKYPDDLDWTDTEQIKSLFTAYEITSDDNKIYYLGPGTSIDLSEYNYFINHHNIKENEADPEVIWLGCGVIAYITFEYRLKRYLSETAVTIPEKWYSDSGETTSSYKAYIQSKEEDLLKEIE